MNCDLHKPIPVFIDSRPEITLGWECERCGTPCDNPYDPLWPRSEWIDQMYLSAKDAKQVMYGDYKVVKKARAGKGRLMAPTMPSTGTRARAAADVRVSLGRAGVHRRAPGPQST